jgi:hypothetical protein|tara:strand:+ start:197 stop:511 length:315 start_codon:yes stop_codon:yes gene_type:complete
MQLISQKENSLFLLENLNCEKKYFTCVVKASGVFSGSKTGTYKVICGKCGNECKPNGFPKSIPELVSMGFICPYCGTKNSVEKSQLEKIYAAQRKATLRQLGVG